MRVFIILASIALAHGAKLERTYLPPSHARSSGGSGNFLQTPISGSTGNTYQNNGLSQNGNGFSQNSNGFSQNGNGFSQTGNDFTQSGNGFSQNGNGLSQSEFNIPHSGSFAKDAETNNVNGFNNFGNFEARPERAQAALERNAAILRQDNINDGETYSYAYETENGIYAEENRVATNGVEAQGGYSYTGDDGQVYSIRYTADQNGFVPQGDHLPTSPPIPEEILKALEQNARDEAAGIYDDGSYNAAKYADVDSNTNGPQNYQQNINAFNGNDDDTIVTNAALARNYPTDADISRGSTSSTGPNGLTGSTKASAGVEKAYLPPFAVPQGGNGFGRAGSTSITGSTSTRASAGVEKAYLPPFASQGANGFSRRQQSFDSRTGYRY